MKHLTLTVQAKTTELMFKLSRWRDS